MLTQLIFLSRSLLADVEESKTYAKPGSMEELLVNKIRNGSPDVLFFKVSHAWH